MDFILFNLISMFENVAVFCLMFAIFRFKVKEYFIHILFSAFLMSQLSYYMRTLFEWGQLSPFTSLVMMILMIWLFFRVQVYYASMMALVSYMAYSSMQALLVLFEISSGMLEQIHPFSMVSYINQLLTGSLSLIISGILLRKRLGFTFVPFRVSSPVSLKGDNLVYILLIVVVSMITGFNYYYFFMKINHIVVVSIMFVVSLALLLYVSLRKEISDD